MFRASPAPPTRENWTKRLSERGLNASRFTVTVLQVLEQSDSAMSHADLFLRLSNDPKTAAPDKVTLYRVLERLRRAGLTRVASNMNRSRRYLLTERVQPCLFECDVCHAAMALPMNAETRATLATLGERLRAQGLTHLHTTLTAHGRCRQCTPATPAKLL